MALIWLQGLKLDISEQTNKNVDFVFLIFDSNLAKLNKNWVNMFQMIIIFTLESKIGFLNLGFGTYYDHCVLGEYFFEPLCPCEDKMNIKKVFRF